MVYPVHISCITQFAVGDEKSVYKLTIGGYQGDAGEA
jgi:hypothetical protein